MSTVVEMYSKDYCPYCKKAAALLNQLGVAFEEYDIQHDQAKFDELQARAPGVRTVPQIFIGDRHIGGCDDMYALYEKGELKPLLGL